MKNNVYMTDYLCFLMNKAGLVAEGEDGYLELCKRLFDFTFTPIVDMDENRIGDIQDMRDKWLERFAYVMPIEEGEMESLIGPGTVMELMIVLAEKMEYEMTDSLYEAGCGKWFQEMMANCGLDKLVNREFDDAGTGDIALKGILIPMLNRRFRWNGEGSFFPLRNPKGDMRNVEILIQMNEYLAENYDIC